MPRLEVDYKNYCIEIDKILDLQSNIATLAARYKKLVTEIIMLRSFSLLENTLRSIACKIPCGAKYCDGSQPDVLVPARSMNSALDKMMSYGREKRLHYPLWTRSKEINENVRHILHNSGHFRVTIAQHGQLIDEMRRIRNRIAHNNDKSRRDFNEVVKRYYGASLRSVTPGILLLSPRRSPILIEQYLSKSRVLIKQIVKG